MRAVVDADVEPLANRRMASAAFLGCAAWIHPEELAPSTFGLGCEDRGELCPCGVVHLFGEAHLFLCQAFNVEVFDRDRVESTNDGERRFVVEVETDAAHLVVPLGEKSDSLASTMRSAFAVRHGR